MRKSIIVNLTLVIIVSLIGCTNNISNKPIKKDLDSVSQKVKELKDKNIQSKLQEEKDLPKSNVDALRIILKEDGEYIQEAYEYSKENYQDEDNMYSGLEEYFVDDNNYDDDHLFNSWDIPKEQGFYIGMLESLNYFVGMETGNVYTLPNQGGVKGYHIKDNKVLRACEWLGDDGTSDDWR